MFMIYFYIGVAILFINSIFSIIFSQEILISQQLFYFLELFG